MKFIISVYNDNKAVTTPCGFGVLENSGNDLEEKAQGEVTINGHTVQASLEMRPAPEPVAPPNPLQIQLDVDGEQPAEN